MALVSTTIGAVLSIVMGVAIIAFPRLVAYLIGAYLILIGVLALLPF